MLLLGFLALAQATSANAPYVPDFFVGDYPYINREAEWAMRPDRAQIAAIAPSTIKFKTAVSYFCMVSGSGVLRDCRVDSVLPVGTDFTATVPIIQKMFVMKKEFLAGSRYASVRFRVAFTTNSKGVELPNNGCYFPFCVGVAAP